mmetsp:Transcript_29753/g.97366  ORF Transcript_29753/g.97366 Transcript_29753/m.97366 type:complete len:205 (+) Transcript_29753:429-1043(+)
MRCGSAQTFGTHSRRGASPTLGLRAGRRIKTQAVGQLRVLGLISRLPLAAQPLLQPQHLRLHRRLPPPSQVLTFQRRPQPHPSPRLLDSTFLPPQLVLLTRPRQRQRRHRRPRQRQPQAALTLIHLHSSCKFQRHHRLLSFPDLAARSPGPQRHPRRPRLRPHRHQHLCPQHVDQRPNCSVPRPLKQRETSPWPPNCMRTPSQD